MKYFLFSILLVSTLLFTSERTQFHTDDITFDDTSSSFLREEHFLSTLYETAKKILNGDAKFVDDSRVYMAADNHLSNFAQRNIRQMSMIGTQSEDLKITVVINGKPHDPSTIFSSLSDKLSDRKSKIP